MGWLDKSVSVGYMREITSTRLYMGDNMIEIGSLVRDSYGDVGLITGYWTHDVSGEHHTVVKWLTGRYVGELDALFNTDNLEVIA